VEWTTRVADSTGRKKLTAENARSVGDDGRSTTHAARGNSTKRRLGGRAQRQLASRRPRVAAGGGSVEHCKVGQRPSPPPSWPSLAQHGLASAVIRVIYQPRNIVRG